MYLTSVLDSAIVGCTTEVRMSDGQIYKVSDNLSELCCITSRPRSEAKLEIPLRRSGDGFTIHHTKLEEHIQHIMVLADQYAFGGSDHFDPEEETKVSQIIHLK